MLEILKSVNLLQDGILSFLSSWKSGQRYRVKNVASWMALQMHTWGDTRTKSRGTKSCSRSDLESDLNSLETWFQGRRH